MKRRVLNSVAKGGSAAGNASSSNAEHGGMEAAAVLNPDLEEVMVSAKSYFQTQGGKINRSLYAQKNHVVQQFQTRNEVEQRVRRKVNLVLNSRYKASKKEESESMMIPNTNSIQR